jgi:hypothetical protein
MQRERRLALNKKEFIDKRLIVHAIRLADTLLDIVSGCRQHSI